MRPFFQGIILLNPLIDLTNNIKIVTTGSNIYGTESTNVDKFLAVTGLILFGVNNIKYIAKPIITNPICERIFSYIEKILTLYSAADTIKNEKNKANNN